ncbi:MAG: hypothetical protein ACXW4B_09575 [Micavibrio sp.]
MTMNDDVNTDKNLKLFSPLKAPELYLRHFNNKEDNIVIRQTDGTETNHWRFETLREVDDPKTGFKASVVIDRDSGHAIVLYKGMDKPFKDEGAGRFSFLHDAFAAAQAMVNGGINRQTRQAEDLYREALNHPDVKSLEVIGFSLGSLHANYMSAKYGAKGTVIADLSLPQNGLTALFNERARNDPGNDLTIQQMEQNMSEDLTVLRLRADLVPTIFGMGPSRGQVIELDEGPKPNLRGLIHLAAIYNQSARGVEERVLNGFDNNAVMTARIPALSGAG